MPRGERWRPDILVTFGALMAALAIGAGLGGSHTARLLAVVTVLIVAGFGILWLLPVRWLPVLAVVGALLIPTDYLPLPPRLIGLPVGFAPMFVWILRSEWRRPRRLYLLACGVAFAGWVIATEVLSPLGGNKAAILGATTVTILCGMCVLQPRPWMEPDRWDARLATLVTPVAAYAIVETFLLHSNPIFGQLFRDSSNPVAQVWSQYRATSTLGQPLMNASIYAPAAVAAAGVCLRRASWSSILRLIILLAALGATRSRTGVVAVIVGLLLLLLFQRGIAGINGRKLVVAAVIALVAAAVASAYLARADSEQAASSTAVRLTVFSDVKRDLAVVGVTGAGFGDAEALQNVDGVARLPAQTVAGYVPGLENGYAEIVVGAGIIGLLLFLTLVVSILVIGLSVPQTVTTACAFASLLIAIAGWKAIDSHPDVIVWLTIFAAPIVGHRASRTAEQPGTQIDSRDSKPVTSGALSNPASNFESGLGR